MQMSFMSREAQERQRAQDSYNDFVGERLRQNNAELARVKDAATRRAVEGALADLLAEGLRLYPDVFAQSRLTRATVGEVAGQFAALISGRGRAGQRRPPRLVPPPRRSRTLRGFARRRRWPRSNARPRTPA